MNARWIVSLQTVNFIETERKVPFQERKSEIFQALLCSVSSRSDNRGWRSGVRTQHFLQKIFKQCWKLQFSYRKLEHSGSVCVWPWEGLRQQYQAGQQGGRHQGDHGAVAGHTQDQAAFLPLGTQGKKSTFLLNKSTWALYPQFRRPEQQNTHTLSGLKSKEVEITHNHREISGDLRWCAK